MAASRLKLQQKNKQKLSASLRQSIQILGLTSYDLRQKIQRELDENPFLEEKGNSVLDIPTLSLFDPAGLHRGTNTSEVDKKALIENIANRGQSLQDYLLLQLESHNLDQDLRKLLEAIISSINEKGFVAMSHEEIARFNNISRKQVSRAKEILLTIDPLGVGAEDTWQSLEWQAQARYPRDYLLQDIISMLKQSTALLSKLNEATVQSLADSLLLNVDIIKEKLLLLEKLDPYPARNFNEMKEQLVYPEIIYKETEHEIQLIVHDRLLPEVSLNNDLYNEFSAVKAQSKKEDRDVWLEKYRQAQNLISSIKYRRKTLESVAQFILHYQADFFLKGTNHIKPLNLADVAEELDVHVSTVSRIISQKYCQCKWGVFSLKTFFPSKIASTNGAVLGSEDLKKAILALVAQENLKKPKSDARLTELLRSSGFDVQRRTVAKYRKLLHIPAAKDRKVF